MAKYFQQLFYVFGRKGIQYDWTADFNDRGQFHGIMIDHWKQIRKEDPLFGTNPNRKRVTIDYLDMIISAIKSGELDPENNPTDLLRVVIFILGYYCALRGKNEHSNLRRDDYVEGTGSEAIRKLEQEKKRLLLEQEVAQLKQQNQMRQQQTYHRSPSPPPCRRSFDDHYLYQVNCYF